MSGQATHFDLMKPGEEIEVVRSYDEDWPVSYEYPGHVDPVQFIARLAAQEGVTTTPERVAHRYRMTVPYHGTHEATCQFDPELVTSFYHYFNKPGRGRKRITTVDHEDTEDVGWQSKPI